MKKNIALIWGGYSSEAIVSAKSADGIYSFLDKDKYNIYRLEITKKGWYVDIDGKNIEVDKNDFSIIEPNNQTKIKFDFAYITIHGTPGEDGRLQGYLEMMKIPHSTCSLETSSLLFNKFYCNNFIKSFDIKVASSILIREGEKYNSSEIVNSLGLPIFVKPSIGGSSFATTKVKEESELDQAIAVAFNEAPQVIVESFIAGTEVTCGCYKIGDKIEALPITEVVTKKEFFDYEAKYEGAVEEITPARISAELTDEIQGLTKKIYNLVGAKGIIRADYIISDNVPYLLEVNTTPGMTKTSFIPQQVAAAGLSITELLTAIIEEELKNSK